MNQRDPGKDFVAAWRAVDEQMQTWPTSAELDAKLLHAANTAEMASDSANASAGLAEKTPAGVTQKTPAGLVEKAAADSVEKAAAGADRPAHKRRTRVRRWTVAAVTLGALGAAAIFIAMAVHRGPSIHSRTEVIVHFSPKRCRPAALTPDLTLDTGCTARLDHLAFTVTAQKPLHLRHTTAGIEIVTGHGLFERTANTTTPVALLVSGGRIEVLAARFSIDQHLGGGAVRMAQGRATFIGDEGQKSSLRAGDRLDWRPSARKWTTQTSTQTAAQIRAIADLRARGRYREAEAQIRMLLDSPLDPKTAEVLSYERGTLLAGPMQQPGAACEHWRWHAERFPAGRYRAAVIKAQRACILQETR
ncbi:MAG: hypothetical protein AAFN74_19955 [Myxococcota bacterium]